MPAGEPAKARNNVEYSIRLCGNQGSSVILSTEADDNVGRICKCHNGVALYRCTDWLLSPILCGGCIMASHATNPFHRIQKWNGFYFGRAVLSDHKQVVSLGYHGALCPNRPPESKGQQLVTTVIHVKN